MYGISELLENENLKMTSIFPFVFESKLFVLLRLRVVFQVQSAGMDTMSACIVRMYYCLMRTQKIEQAFAFQNIETYLFQL